MTARKKYECPKCGVEFTSRTDGRLRKHKEPFAPAGTVCEGSLERVSAAEKRPLTQPEMAVLVLASYGWTDTAIANKFDLSINTIRSRWKDIFYHTNTSDRTHAVAEMLRKRVIF